MIAEGMGLSVGFRCRADLSSRIWATLKYQFWSASLLKTQLRLEAFMLPVEPTLNHAETTCKNTLYAVYPETLNPEP